MFQRVTEEARLTATTGLYRRLCCTRERMQLVVIAAVLALVRVGQGCTNSCHLTDIMVYIESCGMIGTARTTICIGECYQEAPVFVVGGEWPVQTICDAEWSHEWKYIKGCSVAVYYPVARSCKCTKCNEDNRFCEHFPEYKPNC